MDFDEIGDKILLQADMTMSRLDSTDEPEHSSNMLTLYSKSRNIEVNLDIESIDLDLHLILFDSNHIG